MIQLCAKLVLLVRERFNYSVLYTQKDSKLMPCTARGICSICLVDDCVFFIKKDIHPFKLIKYIDNDTNLISLKTKKYEFANKLFDVGCLLNFYFLILYKVL